MFNTNLDQIAKQLVIFPEYPTILVGKKITGDKITREILKQIKGTDDVQIKLLFTLLSCALNQRRLVFVVTRRAIESLAKTSNIPFDHNKYGHFLKLLESSKFFDFVFQEKGSKKPTVIEVIESNIVAYLSEVDKQSQIAECYTFANDLSRFEKNESNEETKKQEKPPQPKKESKQKPEQTTQVFSDFEIPDFENVESYLKPTPYSLAKIEPFLKYIEEKIKNLPSIGSKKEEFERYALALKEIGNEALHLFNEYDDSCFSFQISKNDLHKILEQSLALRFKDQNGLYSINGDIANRARSTVSAYIEAIESYNPYVPNRTFCTPQEWFRYKKINAQIQENNVPDWIREMNDENINKSVVEFSEADLTFHAEIEKKINDDHYAYMKNQLQKAL